MGSLSIWHWLIVLAVVLLLFGGRGKISQLMGDFGKGLKAFKKGVSPEEEAQAAQATQPPPPTPSVDPGKITASAPGTQSASDPAKDKAA